MLQSLFLPLLLPYAVVKATSRKRTAAPWTRVKTQLFASSCCLPSFFFLRRAQFHAQEAVYLHIYAKLPSSRPPGYSLLGIVLLMSEFLLIIDWRRVVQRQLIKRSQRKGTKRCSSVSLPAVKCACAVYTLVAGQRVSMQSVTLASSVKNASGAPHNIPTRNWVSVALICGANNGVEKWRCGLIASFLSGSFAAISATCVQVCS